MPKPTRHSKFVINPDYDEEGEFANTINKAREFLNNELIEVDKIEDVTLQLICIFSSSEKELAIAKIPFKSSLFTGISVLS